MNFDIITLDGATRILLSIGAGHVAGRAIYLLATRKAYRRVARRLALCFVAAPALIWLGFELHLLFTVPTIPGPLNFGVWLSRLAVFVTLVSLTAITEIIVYSEHSEDIELWRDM